MGLSLSDVAAAGALPGLLQEFVGARAIQLAVALGPPREDLNAAGAFREPRGYLVCDDQPARVFGYDLRRASSPDACSAPVALDGLSGTGGAPFVAAPSHQKTLPMSHAHIGLQVTGCGELYADPALKDKLCEGAQLWLAECGLLGYERETIRLAGCSIKTAKDRQQLMVDARHASCWRPPPPGPHGDAAVPGLRGHRTQGQRASLRRHVDIKDAGCLLPIWPAAQRRRFLGAPGLYPGSAGVLMLDGAAVVPSTLPRPRLAALPTRWTHQVVVSPSPNVALALCGQSYGRRKECLRRPGRGARRPGRARGGRLAHLQTIAGGGLCRAGSSTAARRCCRRCHGACGDVGWLLTACCAKKPWPCSATGAGSLHLSGAWFILSCIHAIYPRISALPGRASAGFLEGRTG